MATSELLDSRLQDETFYIRSMSAFLRNSWGMEERCKNYFSILQNILSVGDEFLLDKLNIFKTDDAGNPNYFENPEAEKKDDNEDHTDNVYLDLIGSISGLSRTVKVLDIEWDSVKDTFIIKEEDGNPVYRYITLDNFNFLIYIQAQLLKKHFSGTLLDLRKIYTGTVIKAGDTQEIDTDVDPNYLKTYLASLNICIWTSGIVEGSPQPANATYLLPEKNLSEDLPDTKKDLLRLFISGYLTVESLGITYTYIFGDWTTAVAIFGQSYFFGTPYMQTTEYVFGDSYVKINPKNSEGSVTTVLDGHEYTANNVNNWVFDYWDYWTKSQPEAKQTSTDNNLQVNSPDRIIRVIAYFKEEA